MSEKEKQSKTIDFPTLYSFDSRGNERYWNIKVIDYTIIVRYGQLNGKEICNKQIITSGKNIGKANETTPHEQATSQAQSKWNKKRDSGYNDSRKRLEKTDKQEKEKLHLRPMLALDYHKRSHDITFPCYVQPKIDGVRGFIYRKGEDIIILSRTGKEYPHLGHIKKEIKSSGILLNENVVLDGELYTTELTFEEITGTCRKVAVNKEYHKKMVKIQFWVFDIYILNEPDLSFHQRLDLLKHIFENPLHKLIFVETIQIEKKEHIKECHGKYIEQGFEGIIIRNVEGPYKLQLRSKDLQKYKEFQDSEYTIVGFTEGTGLAEGTVIWECEYTNSSGDTNTFKVRPKGSKEEREFWFENGDEYIGKKLTVRYQELTDFGCPRFPVGISIRDYE